MFLRKKHNKYVNKKMRKQSLKNVLRKTKNVKKQFYVSFTNNNNLLTFLRSILEKVVASRRVHYEASDREHFWKKYIKTLKFLRKFVKQIRFWSSLGRSGSSGKSRATRRQNSSLLRRLATTKTSKKRFGKKLIFLGFGNQFFEIFPWF